MLARVIALLMSPILTGVRRCCRVGPVLMLLAYCITAVATPSATDKRLSHEALQRFGSALEAVRQLYVDDVGDQKILQNAIQGMLTGLDPHSTFLDEEAFSALERSTKGEFTGLGIEVTMKNNLIYVVTPLDDSPAKKAGIQAGDMIVRIDGSPVKGMSLTKAVTLMRGKVGTDVALTIIRPGEKAPMELTVRRAKIDLVSVKHRLIDQHYGYIRISSFGDKTNQAVRDALQDLQQQTAVSGGLYGVVLDLRNNPGGLLEASIDVADVFLDANQIQHDQKVVYTKGRAGKVHIEGKANEPDLSAGVPIVAMINEGSASAAEIVAGALQDHDRAVILGVRSFGKGSVQTVLPLQDGKTALKLTTARYYTPSGRSIQAKGIEPDVVVEALSIPKSAKPEQHFFVREAALDGSLKHESATPPADENAGMDYVEQVLADQDAIAKGKEQRLYTDYQLHRALSLLKALHASHRFGKFGT